MGGYGMGAACAADEPPLGTALGRSIWTQVKFRKYQTVHSEHLFIKKKRIWRRLQDRKTDKPSLIMRKDSFSNATLDSCKALNQQTPTTSIWGGWRYRGDRLSNDSHRRLTPYVVRPTKGTRSE